MGVPCAGCGRAGPAYQPAAGPPWPDAQPQPDRDPEEWTGPTDGVPRACVANADNVTTVLTSRLISRIGPLAPDKLRAVEDALRFALAL
jgi:predicted small lipoprotein YifL